MAGLVLVQLVLFVGCLAGNPQSLGETSGVFRIWSLCVENGQPGETEPLDEETGHHEERPWHVGMPLHVAKPSHGEKP